jgi:uncharacterized protein (TIGR03437 family)
MRLSQPSQLADHVRVFPLCYVYKLLLILTILFAVVRCYAPITAFGGQVAEQFVVVSAADYKPNIAPGSLAVIFGTNLINSDNDKPTISVNDHEARVLFSTKIYNGSVYLFDQINFVVPASEELKPPADNSSALVTVKVASLAGIKVNQRVNLSRIAHGVFSADANGRGKPAAVILRIKPDGKWEYESLKPIDFYQSGSESDILFLVLFLTGARTATLAETRVRIGDNEIIPTYVGPQGDFFGLDQINVPLDKNKLKARGQVRLSVYVHGFLFSNQTEIEITPERSSPAIAGFSCQPLKAGETCPPILVGRELTIAVSGFSTPAKEVEVLFQSTQGELIRGRIVEEKSDDTELVVLVPFGAATGKVIVRGNQGLQISSDEVLEIHPSISGFVERAPGVPAVNYLVSIPDEGIETFTNDEGAWVLPRTVVQDGAGVVIEISEHEGSAGNGLNRLQDSNQINIDNSTNRRRSGSRSKCGNSKKGDTHCGRRGLGDGYDLIAAGGATRIRGDEAITGLRSVQADIDLKGGQVTLTLRSGTKLVSLDDEGDLIANNDEELKNVVKVSVVSAGDSPVRLPARHFSSTIVRVLPFGGKFTLGGKLVFPNTDGLSAGSEAILFRFEQKDKDRIGEFVSAGIARVSQDGKTVETLANAITETGYYFASPSGGWPAGAIVGLIVQPDGRPVTQAVVRARGQEEFTDTHGYFLLRDVPIVNGNKEVTIDVAYMRPDTLRSEGVVERVSRSQVLIEKDSLTQLSPPIVLNLRSSGNRALIIIIPPEINIIRDPGNPQIHHFDFIVTDPGPGQTLTVDKVEQLQGVAVSSKGNGIYTLSLRDDIPAPTLLTLKAEIQQDGKILAATSQMVLVKVINREANKVVARSQAIAVIEDSQKNQIDLSFIGQPTGNVQWIPGKLPSHGTLDRSEPTLYYTPHKDFFGSDSFTYRLITNSGESEAVIFIVIKPINDDPLVEDKRETPPSKETIRPGDKLTLDFEVTDADGELPILTAIDQGIGKQLASSPPPYRISQTTWRYVWEPIAANVGQHKLVFVAKDDNGGITSPYGIDVAVNGELEPTSGPDGGFVNALLADGNYLFAGTSGVCLYRTITENSRELRWNPSGGGVKSINVDALVKYKDKVFAAYSNPQPELVYSTNNGESWTKFDLPTDPTGSPQGPQAIINTFAVINDSLYVGTNRGVFKLKESNSIPAVWESEKLHDKDVVALTLYGQDLYAATSKDGVFKYDSGGAKWSDVNQGLPTRIEDGSSTRKMTSIVVRGTAELYVAMSRDGVFRWDGTTWVSKKDGLPEGKIIYSLLSNKTDGSMLAATPDGIYALVDKDKPWASFSQGLKFPDVKSLDQDSDYLYAGTNGAGVFVRPKQHVAGQDAIWRPASSGLRGGIVTELAELGNTIYAGTAFGLYSSRSNGKTWETIPSLKDANIAALAVFKGKLYVAAIPRVGYLDDNGFLKPISDGLPGNREIYATALKVMDGALWVTSYQGIHRLSDDGAGWLERDRDKNDERICGGCAILSIEIQEIGNSPNKTKILYAGTVQNGIYRSKDDGASWEQINKGLPANLGNRVLSLLALNDRVLAGTDVGIFALKNSGTEWALENSGVITSLAVSSETETLFAGTDGGVGLITSTDYGQSWFRYYEPVNPQDCPPSRTTLALLLREGGRSLLVGTRGSGAQSLLTPGYFWVNRNLGLKVQERNVNVIARQDKDLLLATKGSGVFRLMGGSDTWLSESIGLPPFADVQALVVSDDGANVFAAIRNAGVYRRDNGNNTWQPIPGLADKSINALVIAKRPSDGALMLLAATDQGIYRKNADDSTVWQEPNPSGRGRALSLMVNAGKIYAGMTGNGVKRSDDGVEWRDSFESTSNLRSKSVSALLYHSKNGFYYAGTLSGDIYFSPSGDGNWQLLDRQNLPLEASIRALEQSGSNLYAGTDFGVFEFDNAKQSWSQINAGLFTGVCLESVFDVYVTSFALRPTIDNSSVICAGTRGGVFCYEQLRK